MEARRLLATFTVTSIGDSGAGTLRQAILDSNAAPGANSIGFNIAAGGLQTIAPTTQLPTITVPVTIDGATQPGFTGSPLIAIDGAKLGVGRIGLRITAGSSTVRGLEIVRFRAADLGNYRTFGDGGFAIELATNGGNVIEQDDLGTDGSGSAALGNSAGLHVLNSAANTIGGDSSVTGNVLSGNTIQYPDVPAAYGAGIILDGAGSTGNVVAADFIGLDLTGTRVVANGTGVLLSNARDNTIGGFSAGTRNVISGNDVYDIWLRLNSDGNRIASNLLDTNASGQSPLGGAALTGDPTPATISLEDGSSGNTIGGTLSQGGNVIAPRLVGISLVGAGVTNNVVSGNLIGVDSTGTRPIRANNSFTGILLGSPGNTIGGVVATPSVGNVISGVGNAIQAAPSFILGAGNNTDLSGSLVAGNFLGTDMTGTVSIPDYAGVDLRSGVTGLQIGGSPSLMNVIANNTFGVELEDARKITIRGNSIHDNTNSGIDLTDRPVSNDNVPNPVLDPIEAVGIETGDRFITGTVNGVAGGVYTIDFYANPSAPQTGAGQGKTYLGAGTYTANAQGLVTFTKSFSLPANQAYVTATTTDAAGNTSEFSNPNPRPLGQADLAFAPNFAPLGGEVGRALSYTFSIVNNGPSTATGVTITHTVPAGLDFRAAQVGQGFTLFSNGVVTANIGTLAPGATTYLNIVAYAVSAGAVAATASVSATEADSNLANNTQTLTIPITPATVPIDLLSVTQTASPDPAALGGTVTYTISVRNVGIVTANGVQLSDVLPAGVTLVSAVSSQGQVSVIPGSIAVSLGRIPTTGMATVTVVVRPTTTGAITNLVQVIAVEADQIPSNNSSILTTSVVAAVPLPEGPRIVGFQRLGYHNLPTRLVLTFNAPLDPVRAQDPNNYILSATAEDGRLTFIPTRRITILSAIYDPVVNTVTLRTKSKLDLNRAYHLTVVGASASGVASVSGVPLDGAGTGSGGSDYAATFLGFHVIEIGDPLAKPKATPRHVASKHAVILPKGATLFGHPDVLSARRNPR